MNRLIILGIVVFFLIFSSSKVFAVEQDLVVNEIMYDFPDSDINHEWIELFNSGDSPVTIVGGSSTGAWRINDGSNHTFSTTPSQGSMTVGSGEYIIITKSASTFLSDNPGFSGNIVESSINLNNTSATVSLRINADGALWGQLSYQNTQGGAGDGNTLQKKSDATLIASLATPGKQNASDPPTPTPTATPALTPTPSPTPTSSPTKTPTPVSSSTPTPLPTQAATPTNSPSSSVISPTNRTFNNSVTLAVLGDDTSQEKSESELLVKGAKNSKENPWPAILMGVGIILLISCGILAFREYKKGKNEIV